MLSIGGLGLRFDGCATAELPPSFASFSARVRPLARYRVLEVRPQDRGGGALLTDSDVWRLYERRDGVRFEGYAPGLHGRRPVLQADLSRDWTTGVVRVDPELAPKVTRSAPITTHLGELALIALLGAGRGLYVHAAAARFGRGVVLFLGASGAGKSTLSGIAKQAGAEILSDDRTVLRVRGGRLLAYGTPFHGTGKHWARGGQRVSGLFFLEHASRSVATPLSAGAAAAQLASLCFAQFWDKQALERTLGMALDAATRVACFRLQVCPDESAIRAIAAVRE